MMKRRRALLMAAAQGGDEPMVIASGQCGDNAYWDLYSTGLLDIHGSGNMYDFGSYLPPGWAAFYEQIRTITIQNGITSIGNGAFGGYIGLESIMIPDSVTSIGSDAFAWCYGLTSIEIPNSVTSIGDLAFGGCAGLESINVDENNTKYHSSGNCFIETASKTLIVGCKNSVIPSDGSVTSIGSYAFLYCTGLTSIEIPDGVTSIGSNAFFGCNGLTSIEISNSVTSIGPVTFADCASLTDIYCYFAPGAVSGAPWEAPESTQIHYIYYPDTPDISGVCGMSQSLGIGTLSAGIMTNNGVISQNDTVRIEADIIGTDLEFIDMTVGDEYQQTAAQVASVLGVTMQYAVMVNCHGLYVKDDYSEAYLVKVDGTEQTEDAFYLGIGTDSHGIDVLFVFSNNNYPLSGNYEIYKKRFETQ